jgi:hypothetical protein
VSDDDFHITDVLPMFTEETDDMSGDQDTFCSSERPSIDREQTPHAPYGILGQSEPFAGDSPRDRIERAVIDRLPKDFYDWGEGPVGLFEAAIELIEAALDAPSGLQILEEVFDVAATLLDKNRRYGDSAIEPLRIMSDADAVEQIDVRIDDKISRLNQSAADDPEDVLLDLLGYIVLRRVAVRRRRD